VKIKKQTLSLILLLVLSFVLRMGISFYSGGAESDAADADSIPARSGVCRDGGVVVDGDGRQRALPGGHGHR